jgi:hypothetical protein
MHYQSMDLRSAQSTSSRFFLFSHYCKMQSHNPNLNVLDWISNLKVKVKVVGSYTVLCMYVYAVHYIYAHPYNMYMYVWMYIDMI